MPYRLILTLFDYRTAIQERIHVKQFADDTPTGLPFKQDYRIREAALPLLTSLFDNITAIQPVEEPSEPETAPFDLEGYRPKPARRPFQIAPIFAPLRQLDYRFQKLSVDWQDMMKGSRARSGSIDAGFGIVHLLRDQDDSNMYESTANDQNADPNANVIHGEGRMLAVLAIPPIMSVNEFLLFVEPFAHFIQQVRILRDEMPNRCMALMRMRTEEEARLFLSEFNGKPFFAMLDDEICQVLRVSSVTVRSSTIPPYTFPLTPDAIDSSISPVIPGNGSIELPSCVVCLERMDPQISGLITIPCQHTFHCACLSKWASGKCPVCRYTSQNRHRAGLVGSLPSPVDDEPRGETLCEECGTASSLWMCLICGHVGCGRYAGKHAADHYDQSFHLYAMELETQRVWDYAGDAYVHRLIQNKADGKLVELPSIGSAESPFNTERSDRGEGPNYADSAAQNKMERMSEEFSHLLSSQLDSQRAYYVAKLTELKQELAIAASNLEASQRANHESIKEDLDLLQHKHGIELKEATSKIQVALQQKASLEQRLANLESSVIPDLERENARLEKKTEKAVQAARLAQNDLFAEKDISNGLLKNLQQLRNDLKASHEETAAIRVEQNELKDQLRDVMAFLDTRDKVEAAGGAESVEVRQRVTSIAPSPARKKKKAKKPPLAAIISQEEDAPAETSTSKT